MNILILYSKLLHKFDQGFLDIQYHIELRDNIYALKSETRPGELAAF